MRLTKYEPNKMSMFPYKLKDEELSTELNSIHKLGQLEDIEKELGIYLITLFKALKNGVYWKRNDGYVSHVNVGHFILESEYQLRLDIPIRLKLKDYGKTWALTKEELL